MVMGYDSYRPYPFLSRSPTLAVGRRAKNRVGDEKYDRGT